ncbi:MAG: GIY-YIG nuclease family protein [Candidatus Taylorbacteria bacterium]|nr:GIY-YIG nuclease family protein [Candidatus Taylorbacteria bacterium]
MYYIYAIYNTIADKIYIGQSENLEERLKWHNEKRFKGYTSRFEGRWKIIYREECQTRLDALKREKQLKSYRGREFIKKYLQDKE